MIKNTERNISRCRMTPELTLGAEYEDCHIIVAVRHHEVSVGCHRECKRSERGLNLVTI